MKGCIRYMKKVLLVVVGVIAVTVVTGIVGVNLLSSANKPKGNKEEILKSSKQSAQKALIVYQPSISSIMSKIVHQIAKGLNDGGYEVTLNYPGDHLTTDVSKYSVVVFGAPVYGGGPAAVLTDYMSKVKDYSSSKVVLLSTGSMDDDKELNQMEGFLNGAKANKKIKFKTKNKEGENIAYNLGKELAK